MKLKKYLEVAAIGHPKISIGFFILLTALMATLLPGLTKDTNPFLLPETHESRVVWEKVKDTFTGLKGNTYVMLEADDTVFNPETLERLQKLTEAFQAIWLVQETDIAQLQEIADKTKGEAKLILERFIKGGATGDDWEQLENARELLESSGQWDNKTSAVFKLITTRMAPVIEVTSMANTDNIRGYEGGLDISPIYEKVPVTAEGMKRIKEDVEDNELFKGAFSIGNGKYTSLIVETMIGDNDTETKYLMYQALLNVLDKEVPGPEKHYIAGMPVFSATLSHTMNTDVSRLFPIVFVLVMICLWVAFRMFKGVIVPLLVVILSLVITLALKVVFDIPLNIISTSLPVFILSIGVADGIHMFSEFRDHISAGMTKIEAAGKTLQELASPVIMTSLTTAAAFLSLGATEIVQIRHFGIFVAVGTLIAMVYSLMFIPALLVVLPQKPVEEKSQKKGVDRYLLPGLEWASRAVIKYPRPILAATAIVLVISAYGFMQVRVENDVIGYFKSDSDLVVSTHKIDTVAVGSSMLSLQVKSTDDENEPFKNPANLNAIVSLADFIEKLPKVGRVTGLNDLIERIDLVINNGNPQFQKIIQGEKPFAADNSGREIISQYLLLYENSGGDVLSDVVDSTYNQLILRAMIRTNSSSEIADLTDRINTYLSVNLPDNLTASISGTAHLNTEATNEIVNGQINSFVLSIIITFILLMMTFRSAVTGVLAIIPLVTTIFINFGVMGYLGITLNIGTAIISSIVIGVGVDYSIHYLSRLQSGLKKGLSFNDAIMETVQFSGKAIVVNAITVAIGFAALLFSSVTPMITVGWMIILTMVVSSFCTIVLLPAFITVFSHSMVKKWSIQPLPEITYKPEKIHT